MKMYKLPFILSFLSFIVLFSCSKDKKKSKEKDSYFHGKITLLTDDGYKSVAEALSDAYAIQYPEAQIKTKVEKEDFALLALLQKKAEIAVLSRELTNEEKEMFKQQMGMEYNPVYFAADAVAFVVAKDSPIEFITLKEIQKRLESEEKTLVFDGANAANLNFVAQYYKQKPATLKYSVVKGNEGVLQEIPKHSNSIGVISLNSFSRDYSPKMKEFRKNIKVLPIRVKDKDIYPNVNHLRDFSYPFTRKLYFLTHEKTFQMSHGFMRFACSQVGQLVVEKEGLQPYYLFKREVQMR